MSNPINLYHRRSLIFVLLSLISISLNSFGLELKFHTKVPIPSDITKSSSENIRIGSMRNDGAFLAQTGYDPKGGSIGWLIQPDGNYITFSPRNDSAIRTTNIVSISQENGQAVIILDELVLSTIKINNGELLLKSASPNGCLFNESVFASSNKTTYKLIANKIDSYQEYSFSTNYTIITKYNGQGKFVEILKINGITTLQNDGPGFFTESPNANKVYSAEVKDGYIYFYRLTDSDLLSSPNRITLGSSQNGSITATVNNPEQNLLNIQSSTNLIDWSTFKTIQNEPSLEIIVPANKQKEFIRAVE